MNNNYLSAHSVSEKGTGVQRTSQHWLRLPLLLMMVAIAVVLLAATALADSSPASADSAFAPTVPTVPTVPPPPPAVIYLGFKTSGEIDDFKYKNEDIVAYDPATQAFSIFFNGSDFGLSNANLDDFEILPNGHIIFTLRSKFNIPGLGEVDDSDVVEYTPGGGFTFYLVGASVGLTKGAEDIDALGFAPDGKLIISTIGTAKVPGIAFDVKDQDLIKLESSAGGGNWSFYFDGSDVELTDSSEDVRSAWTDTTGDQNLYLTLSGDFEVESANQDEGDKDDVEGCTPLSLGANTECFFFKLFDGDEVDANKQLDGLFVIFDPVNVAASAVASNTGDTTNESAEGASDIADFAEANSENDSEITADDFFEVAGRVYLPLLQR